MFTCGNDVAQPFLIRDAKLSDLDNIFELGSMLNTLNLPADKNALEQVIAASEQSFALQERDLSKRAFLFVMENPQGQVIGTSQIFAKHGTLDSPHSFFQVELDERYSDTLKKYFRHRTLLLRQSFDGPTEIGSLILHKKYRSSPFKLGRNLSFVRFLFMAMNKDFFADRVIAELLPPLGPNFESALWDAIGRKFTGLDYYEADMLSRNNKEFIKTLFPSNEIYVSLLPDAAQEVIGQIGINSKAAAHLLSAIGFRYSSRVDPFDGGPHFEARRDDISLIKDALFGVLKSDGNRKPLTGVLRAGLLGHYEPKEDTGRRFKAIMTSYLFDKENKEIHVHENTLKALDLLTGVPITLIDMMSEA